MCGHVGIAGDLVAKDAEVMNLLLLLDSKRGLDSTGIAAIRKHGNDPVHIAKALGNPFNLFDTRQYDLVRTPLQSKAFIGHNRAKTRGAATVVNAHPFHFGHIVGAHNGTLDTLTKFDIDEEYNVDSQELYASMAKNGLKDTISAAMGAWALVWFDTQTDTINFLRNSERPLWFAFTEDRKKIIWASEYWMIATVARAFDHIKIETDDKGNAYYPFTEDVHYSLPVPSVIPAAGLDKLKIKTGFVGKEKPSYSYGGSPFHWSGHKNNQQALPNHSTQSHYKNPESSIEVGSYNDHGWWDIKGKFSLWPSDPVEREKGKAIAKTTKTGGTTQTKALVVKNQSKNGGKVVELFPKDLKEDDPYAGSITKERFDEISRFGCSYCSETVEWGDKGIAIFPANDVILCAGCADDDVTKISRVYL